MNRVERATLTVAAIYQREAQALADMARIMLLNGMSAHSYYAECGYLSEARAYQAKAANRYRDARQVMGLEPIHTA